MRPRSAAVEPPVHSSEAFHPHQTLAAFEGDARIFGAEWDREIARDLVCTTRTGGRRWIDLSH